VIAMEEYADLLGEIYLERSRYLLNTDEAENFLKWQILKSRQGLCDHNYGNWRYKICQYI